MKDEIKEIFVDYWEFANDASDNLLIGLVTFLAVVICVFTTILIIPVLTVGKTIDKAWRKTK